jgi:glutamate-1-semialdehyde 2,1-aminomutase
MKKLVTEKSKKLFERALKSIPGGVSSASRSTLEGYAPYPPYIEKALGSKLYDVDGNEYIDYFQALGPTLVGNANPQIVNFVIEQIQKGATYGLPFEMQIEVAEKLIRHVPCFEKVSFMNSGTEVVQMVLRLARAYTKRSIIAKFEGAYHGWIDNVAHSVHPPLELDGPDLVQQKQTIGTGIPARAYEDFMVLPFNNVQVLEKALEQHGDKIAGLIMDPCMCNSGVIPPEREFLDAARELTKKHGIVMIFDEVITGFRLGLHSAQGKFGVTPDLTAMAKAVGGGFPVATYGGKAEIMDLLADGTVFRAGTVNANRMAMAAAFATLQFLEKNNGEVYRQIYRIGEKLMNGIQTLIDRENIRAIIQGFGPMFQIHFTPLDRIRNYRDYCQSDLDTYMVLRNKLLPRGIFLRPAHFGEVYISAAHSDEDIEKTLVAMEEAMLEMKEEGLV